MHYSILKFLFEEDKKFIILKIYLMTMQHFFSFLSELFEGWIVLQEKAESKVIFLNIFEALIFWNHTAH